MMPRFRQRTGPDGDTVYINVDHIAYMIPCGDHTDVTFNDLGTISVNETILDILAMVPPCNN